jgi:hypothetical protein
VKPLSKRNDKKHGLDTDEAAMVLRIPPVFLAQLIHEGRLRLQRGFLIRREDVESLREYSRRRFDNLDS